MLESQIQIQIVQYLKLKKIVFFSVPNEAVNSMQRMMKLKKMGLRPGVSDLVILLKNGKSLFVEVKAKKGRQSDNQIKFEKDIKKLGFNYYLVRSLKDLISVLD